jgi:hypothetical protein
VLLITLVTWHFTIGSLYLNGTPQPSLKDFHGLKLNFFHKETGRRYLKVSYKDAIAENKKIGFLTMNLAFLKINDLEIEMDARHLECSKIISLFDKVSKQRGVRYAVAEPIDLTVKTPNSQIRITGDKGKFSTDGTLKVWGNVRMITGETELQTSKVTLSTDEANNSFVLSPADGSGDLIIPLGSTDTTSSAPDPLPSPEKANTTGTR